MLMRFLCLYLIVLLLPSSLLSQIMVREVGTDFNPVDKRGVFYMLPQTGFQFDVHVLKTVKVRGPYADYASKYLGLDNVITSDQVIYTLGDIQMTTFTVADPGHLFFVEYDEKQAKDNQEVEILFSRYGCLSGITSTTEKKPAAGVQMNEYLPDRDSLERLFRLRAGDNLYTKTDTIIRKITLDTLTIEDISFKHSVASMSPEQKAAEAAEFIETLRTNQHNLLIGYQEVPYSEGTLRFMLGQLRKLENEYLDLFRGKYIREELVYQHSYIPKQEDADSWIPLFRFSPLSGFQLPESGSDPAVFMKITLSGDTDKLSSVMQDIATTDVKESRGFFTRFPQMANISLRYGNDIRNITQLLMPQYGVIVSIPASFRHVSLFPETGGLERVRVKF